MKNNLKVYVPPKWANAKGMKGFTKDTESKIYLGHYTWIVDYSNTTGQKYGETPPQLFRTRSEARKQTQFFPHGVVRKVRITVVKTK